MASITNVWDARFSLFSGLRQSSHDSVVVRALKKRSQEAISRAAYLCAEEHAEGTGGGRVGDGDRDFVGLTSLFPARDQVGTFIGFSDRDGRAEGIGEGTEVLPLLRVGSSSHYIGLAAILDERDWLRESIRRWEIYEEQRTADLDWLTELGGCGTPDDWFVDEGGNEGENCVAVQQWAEWSEVWQEYRADCQRHANVPRNWWELVDLYDNEVSKAVAAQHRAEVEKDRALAEVETQKAACKNSWAAQKERDESALAEIGRMAAEKEALKKKVVALEKDRERLTKKNLEMEFQIDALETGASANISASENRERALKKKVVSLEVDLEMAEKSRMEAADACLAIQRKNSRLQGVIKVILNAGQEVYEEDE